MGEEKCEINVIAYVYVILQLKESLEIDYIVAFGDGKNDIEMFEKADESYTAENAVDDINKSELRNRKPGVVCSRQKEYITPFLVSRLQINHRLRRLAFIIWYCLFPYSGEKSIRSKYYVEIGH